MRIFSIGILGAVLALSQGLAATNTPSAAPTAPAPEVSAKPTPDAELEKIMEADDAVQEEVDRWIRGNQEFAARGAGEASSDLNRRIEEKFAPVKKAYEEFIRQHPDHAKGRTAYASFLGDMGDEESARLQLEKALTIDTNNPAIYNNLANICGHIGPVKQAFEYYAKAIELNPKESIYYHNFGTTVYMFRTDAMEFYHIDEKQVFDKALGLYSNAIRLNPQDFPLATDVAQSYYGIQPMRTEEALRSWTNALSLAHDEIEREGVYIHFARIKTMAGRFAEAQAHLDSVTNEMYADLKKRLVKNLDLRQKEAAGTNAPAEAGSVEAKK